MFAILQKARRMASAMFYGGRQNDLRHPPKFCGGAHPLIIMAEVNQLSIVAESNSGLRRLPVHGFAVRRAGKAGIPPQISKAITYWRITLDIFDVKGKYRYHWLCLCLHAEVALRHAGVGFHFYASQ